MSVNLYDSTIDLKFDLDLDTFHDDTMAKKLELQWSQPYVVKDVAGFYRNMLPIIVQVEEGYSGITDEETYSRDDVSVAIVLYGQSWRYI